jgi:CelD/BcsL family acetyltransferase involved in cellulose biosynthesis
MQIAALGQWNRAPASAARADGAAHRISIITERAGFDALEAQWNALFERAGHPHQLFQSFNWLWHWANHYLDAGSGLSILSGWREDRLVMVWPMAIVRSAGVRKLTWMGDPVSPYGDVLIEDGPDVPDLLRAGWAAARSLDVDLVALPGVRRDAVVGPLLAATGAIATASMSAPMLQLAGEALRRASAKALSGRRRRLRRLGEAGTIAFEQQTQGPAARDLIEQALRLKRSWLRERGLVSRSLGDARFDRFFGDIVLAERRPVGARVCALRCNDEPIAIEISFACRNWVFGHVIAHDQAFRRHGVGMILADYSIQAAREQGIVAYDLLPPISAQKAELADAAVGVEDWAIPLSRRGEVFARFWLKRGRHWLKAALLSLPVSVRRVLAAAHRRQRGDLNQAI